MVVLYPDLLGAEDRKRLLAMLAQPPLVAQPASSWSRRRALTTGVLVVLLAGVFVCRAPLPAWICRDTFLTDLACGAALAIAVGLTCALALALLRRRSLLRAPYRCGRFLYPFGLVDAQPARVVIIPGSRLSGIAVRVGRPSVTGISWVTVKVQSERARHRLRFRGLDVDVPPDLDAVLRAAWQSPEGYRTAREPFPTVGRRSVREAPAWIGPAIVATAAILTFGVTETWVLPERALDRAAQSTRPIQALSELAAHPWPPWLRARALHEIEVRWGEREATITRSLRGRWREEGLELVRQRLVGEAPYRLVGGSNCSGAYEVDGWVERQLAVSGAVVRPRLVPFRGGPSAHFEGRWLDRYLPVLGESTSGHVFVSSRPIAPNAIAATASCTVTPTRVDWTFDGRPYAALDVEFTASFQLAGRPPITTTLTLPAEDRAAGTPDHELPYDTWARRVRLRIDEHMSRVMFADAE